MIWPQNFQHGSLPLSPTHSSTALPAPHCFLDILPQGLWTCYSQYLDCSSPTSFGFLTPFKSLL